jgi:hypothetical protein
MGLGLTQRSPSALVHRAEELGDIHVVMCSDFLQHLLIPHTPAECKHNRSIGDTSNGVAN